jgi:hypothetical protein
VDVWITSVYCASIILMFTKIYNLILLYPSKLMKIIVFQVKKYLTQMQYETGQVNFLNVQNWLNIPILLDI